PPQTGGYGAAVGQAKLELRDGAVEVGAGFGQGPAAAGLGGGALIADSASRWRMAWRTIFNGKSERAGSEIGIRPG
ncbi:MAG TPA: hypothetical protein VE197_11225, partial [Mycobacterium sp.]|nr:hypothetical protein [Mycobacterium sp.]